jgi:plastocyanin
MVPRLAKILGSVVAFVAGLSVAVVPSLGANQDVAATASNTFDPATVTIGVGDSVTWRNADGLHNVKFDDGLFTEPSSPDSSNWTVSRTFTTAGSYRYYCVQHESAGMIGTVVVNAGSTGPGGGGGGGTTNPPASNLQDKVRPKVKLSAAATQRILAKRGLVVTVRVNEAATITATGRVNVPGASRVLKLKSVKRKVDAGGPAKLKLRASSKVRKALAKALRRKSRLKARVSIVARDAAGNSGTSRRTIAIRK